MCTRMQLPEEARGIGSPGAGAIGTCELPGVGTGNLT